MSKKADTKKIVLLDVHAILHRAYHALPDFSTASGIPTGGLYGVSLMILKLIEDFSPDYIIACYDLPKPTYRHEVYKEYKAGRAKADDELVAQIINSHKIFDALHIPMYSKEGFEADDMLGTIVEQTKKRKDLDIVIASGDMDTLQLVDDKKVQVYTLKKGIKDTVLYDEEGVVARFGFGPELLPDYKGLRGDPSDNIVGVRGIGDKTATELITRFGTLENMYKKLKKNKEEFISAGIKPRIIDLLLLHEEEALFSKMLATIRRDAPITFSLPEKGFKDGLDLEKADAFFREFEFRTLGARLRSVLKLEAVVAEEKSKLPEVDQKDLDRVALKLWVFDSNHTNATLEDIFAFTKKKTLKEAEAVIDAKLKESKSDGVYKNIEEPLVEILEKMKEYGIKINTARFSELSKTYHGTLSKLEKNIHEQAGVEFNIASPKQLGEVLFEKLGLKTKNQKKTAGGAFSTKESELEKLREVHPIISNILEYRELAKLLGTYVDVLPTLADKNGRIHSTFDQSGTATGRMASHDPNLQNIPNKTDLGRAIRSGFIPEKGYKLVAIDYSQIELRIAAFLSKDEKLIAIFNSNEDVHTAVASQVFNVSPEKVDKEMRRKAKVINFGIIYGMGVNALKQNLGTDRAEAQNFYNEYFAKFSGLASYLEKTKESAHRLGYTTTFFGRRRYFEGIRSRIPFIRASAERMAINAPVQGTGADIIKLAMIAVTDYISKHSKPDSIHLLLQVHDELVFEVEESIVSEVIPALQSAMESVIDPRETEGVVCRTEASVGDNWGEMKRI
ncbi:MAG: DNA polymerase [Candidatus Paceibacterota bacterium]